ncbi:hypothetical protein GF420_00150 [candidate division GN15 bacterium]|nr:hypothetical protein [candidate division GN15 bacterium]
MIATDDQSAMRAMADDGVHPVEGSPFIVLGSYMAAQLDKTNSRDDLYGFGSGRVFRLWNEFASSDDGLGASLDDDLKTQVGEWHAAWQATMTDDINAVASADAFDLAAHGPLLKETFAGQTVYPDFTEILTSSMEDALGRADIGQASAITDLAVELYPNSARAHRDRGIVLLFTSGKNAAEEEIIRAHRLDPDAIAGAAGLNMYAYGMKNAGATKQGLHLLEIAVALHPDVANLYDSIGEFHLALGDREQSKEYYRKALEIDPKFENARRMLERIESDS